MVALHGTCSSLPGVQGCCNSWNTHRSLPQGYTVVLGPVFTALGPSTMDPKTPIIGLRGKRQERFESDLKSLLEPRAAGPTPSAPSDSTLSYLATWGPSRFPPLLRPVLRHKGECYQKATGEG